MTPHPTNDQIACFLVQGLRQGEEERVRLHLRDCRQCQALAEFGSRMHGQFIDDPDAFAYKDELVEDGMAVARAGAMVEDDPGRRATSRYSRGWIRWAAPVAAAAAILAIAWPFARPGHDGVEDVLVAPLRASMIAMSKRALFVVPGTETEIGPTVNTYRSGGVAENDKVSAALLSLVERYNDDPGDRDVAYWVMGGFLATRQFNIAADIANEALERFPKDSELASLAAVIEYARGNFEMSERLLRQVVAAEPANWVAQLDLGVVLMAQGRRDEARDVLQAVEQGDNNALSSRAKWIIDDNDS